jgi:hypothetical protein
MRRGEFGWRLFAADLPEPTAQKGDDFLLNLRIIQQMHSICLSGLVLLCLLDLIFRLYDYALGFVSRVSHFL